jgi:hypothetical protein
MTDVQRGDAKSVRGGSGAGSPDDGNRRPCWQG